MRYANEMGCCTPATSQPRGPQSSYTVVRGPRIRVAQGPARVLALHPELRVGREGPVAERAGRGAAAARRVAAAPAELLLLPHGPTAVEAGVGTFHGFLTKCYTFSLFQSLRYTPHGVQPEQRVVR